MSQAAEQNKEEQACAVPPLRAKRADRPPAPTLWTALRVALEQAC